MSSGKLVKTQIIFAHSGGAQYGPGKGSYDLVKYLRSRLKTAYTIRFPLIDKPNSPTYPKFKKMFRQEFSRLDGPVILVGHSLGASTLLKYLSEEKRSISILGLFLVATPHWKSNMKEYQLQPGFQKALRDIPTIHLYNSLSDETVPIDHLEFFAKTFKKRAVVTRLRGNEHTFNRGLPELVRDIKSI